MQSATVSRYIKIGADGAQLPRDATEWDAVLDTRTGLTWTARNIAANELTLDGANAAAKALDLAGATDWRVPEIEALLLLADRSKFSPAIDAEFFPDTELDWYWSSSPCVGREGYAWQVNFGNGNAGFARRGSKAFVRAVRGPSQS